MIEPSEIFLLLNFQTCTCFWDFITPLPPKKTLLYLLIITSDIILPPLFSSIIFTLAVIVFIFLLSSSLFMDCIIDFPFPPPPTPSFHRPTWLTLQQSDEFYISTIAFLFMYLTSFCLLHKQPPFLPSTLSLSMQLFLTATFSPSSGYTLFECVCVVITLPL